MPNLDRVRHKVEKGERLTDAELELLRRAAQSQGGPSLRLAVAHALINAEQPLQALPLLEALRREFPRELQVRLGHARALFCLERFPDAERALQDALALSPNDPEALKGLATLDLRRGEIARARARLDAVLRVDPFDGEAQLLKADLDAFEPPPAGPERASRDAFTRALVAQLEAQSTPHLLQKEHLLVRLGKDEVARVDLRSLHAGYLEDARELRDAVEAIARELAERSVGVPEGREALLERVLPVLREAGFVDRALGAVRREGPAGLWVFYVLDDSELVRYLPEGALQSHSVSLEEVDAAAWKNLEARSTAPRRVEIEGGRLLVASGPSPLFALAEGDGHDGARLLTPAQRGLIAEAMGSGPYRVFLGMREIAVLCREEDAAAVQALHTLPAAEDGVGGRFRLDHGLLTTVLG